MKATMLLGQICISAFFVICLAGAEALDASDNARILINKTQVAEPKGTLTLACQGTKSETTPRIADADQSSVSVDIIIDFGPRPLRCTRGTTPCGPNQREIMSVHMEQYESAPLFKADNATLSFYATKDGKISVTIRGWDQSKTVLAGQTVCAELGASTPCGPNHRCPSAQDC